MDVRQYQDDEKMEAERAVMIQKYLAANYNWDINLDQAKYAVKAVDTIDLILFRKYWLPDLKETK